MCKRCFRPSTLLHKFRAAFGAADHDPSLPSGDPDLLAAVRTLVDMILNALTRIAALSVQEEEKSVLQREKFLIFSISSGNIPRKSPEIDDEEQDNIDDACDLYEFEHAREGEKTVGDHLQQDQDDDDRGQEAGELVCPVSALHKDGKTITQFVQHF